MNKKRCNTLLPLVQLLPAVAAAAAVLFALPRTAPVLAAVPERLAVVMEQPVEAASVETEEEALPKLPYADGVYVGSSRGYGGAVRVQVTMENGSITEVEILDASHETKQFLRRAKRLLTTVVDAQSWEVDAVSEATYTSRGILGAVQNALTGEVVNNPLPPQPKPAAPLVVEEFTTPSTYLDGIYTAEAIGFEGKITVQITVAEDKITDITVLSAEDEEEYLSRAKRVIPAILEGQSPNVDAVSGATYSSTGILNAVKLALAKAAVAPAEETDPEQAASEEVVEEATPSEAAEPEETPVTAPTVEVVQPEETLDEVVVVGYGSMSRKDVTSSITTVKADKLNVGVYSDPGQLLQGKVPGLTVVQSSDPTSGTASISLRGASSLRTGAAMEPYYVIDGIPGMSLSLIAPEDIESIDVLRDASATAIYGSKAANGVILITTKKGSKSEHTSVNYSAYLAFDNIAKRLDMMTADELRTYAKENNITLPNDKGANTNWNDEVLRTAISHNHNVSINGGSEKTQYSASMSYQNKQGIVRGTDFERFGGRAFLQTKALNDRLTLAFLMPLPLYGSGGRLARTSAANWPTFSLSIPLMMIWFGFGTSIWMSAFSDMVIVCEKPRCMTRFCPSFAAL